MRQGTQAVTDRKRRPRDEQIEAKKYQEEEEKDERQRRQVNIGRKGLKTEDTQDLIRTSKDSERGRK